MMEGPLVRGTGREEGLTCQPEGTQSKPENQAPEGDWVELCRWTIRISGQPPGNLQKQWLRTQVFPQTLQEILLRGPIGLQDLEQ